MESFFVPIYLKLGKLSDEKLLVALIMITPEQIWMKYSQKRIQLSSQIINSDYSNLAKEVLSQIENKANQVNAISNKPNELKFDNPHVFTIEYFEYLKKYSQNTLLFGSVEKNNAIHSKEDFNAFYEVLLNEKIELVKSVKKNFSTKVKTKLKESNIEDKADIDYKLSSKKITGLYNDTNITLISKNGSIIAAEAIDFNIGMPSLTNSLNSFEVLINSLNQFSEINHFPKGTYYILNSIPQSGSEQEKLLNKIHQNKSQLKLISEDEIDEITEKIHFGNYTKFSSILK